MIVLTQREIEIAKAVGRGLPNKMIARELGLPEHTVKINVHSLIVKTGCSTRTKLAIQAHAEGLLRLPKPQGWSAVTYSPVSEVSHG